MEEYDVSHQWGSHHNDIIGMKDVFFFFFIIIIIGRIMGLEKIFILKRIIDFLEISQFWLLFVVIWKRKKIFWGLIREYFNNLDDST